MTPKMLRPDGGNVGPKKLEAVISWRPLLAHRKNLTSEIFRGDERPRATLFIFPAGRRT
jgi:hypothetical protein